MNKLQVFLLTLLLSLLIVFLSALQAQYSYTGTVGRAPITLTLPAVVQQQDPLVHLTSHTVTATYHYHRYKTPIALSVFWNYYGDLILEEESEGGRTYFRLKDFSPTKEELRGTCPSRVWPSFKTTVPSIH